VSTANVLPQTLDNLNEILSVVFIGPGKYKKECLENLSYGLLLAHSINMSIGFPKVLIAVAACCQPKVGSLHLQNENGGSTCNIYVKRSNDKNSLPLAKQRRCQDAVLFKLPLFTSILTVQKTSPINRTHNMFHIHKPIVWDFYSD
jgi:hypothetical protein